MFKQFCVAIILILGVEVILHVRSADAKTRGKRRRCPNACVRKFNNYRKEAVGSPGPQGPPGPPGPEGPRGQQGQFIQLPKCGLDEYLTSDGVSLRCVKLDVCSGIRKDCPQKEEGKRTMIKFMKENMIQSLQLDAWDVEAFYIGRSLFVGLSQLGSNSFNVYKWSNGPDRKGSFLLFQKIKVPSSRNWKPFKIGGDTYFVIASNSASQPCPIYKWDELKDEFIKFPQSLECARAFDVQPFMLNGVQHIAVANYQRYKSSAVFKWNGRGFDKIQDIRIAAKYVEAFVVDEDTYLGVSGAMGKGPYVFLLKWSGKEFKRTQRIFTIDRPYGLAALSIGKQEFLAIATYGRPKQPTRSLVFKWNGKKFESFQNISSVGARRVAAISSPLMGKENTYLAVVNSFDKPVIYVWDHENGDRFKILHNIEAERARDISFFEMGNSVYLLVTSYQQMYVFKGAEA